MKELYTSNSYNLNIDFY